VRTRIDEFGTDGAGRTDPGPVPPDRGACGREGPAGPRRDSADGVLEFRITDMKGLVQDALPQIDAVLRKAGVKSRGAAAPSAVAQLFGGIPQGGA